jgi:GntR family transcriptional repressor for pyruvate dehydrogenase complex
LGGDSRAGSRLISDVLEHPAHPYTRRLVDYCPNPLMAFVCRFLLSLLKNLTICRRIYGIPNPELREHGRSYQLRLIAALREGDGEEARRIMDEHMRYAGHMMKVQEAFVARQFLKVD